MKVFIGVVLATIIMSAFWINYYDNKIASGKKEIIQLKAENSKLIEEKYKIVKEFVAVQKERNRYIIEHARKKKWRDS